MQDYQSTWDTYTAAWKAETASQKRVLFLKSLSPNCLYTDPLIQANGWDELEGYMLDFHQQIPGGHFVTHYFLAHHDKSIARWDMLNGEGVKIGEGISYGSYGSDGKLQAMTGFFEWPTES